MTSIDHCFNPKQAFRTEAYIAMKMSITTIAKKSGIT